MSAGVDLARSGFDLGLLTDAGDKMLSFWTKERGLPVERIFEPMPGIRQHKLSLAGGVLKVNSFDERLPRTQLRSGYRLLRLVQDGIEESQHVRDPDGNVVELVPPDRGLRTIGIHLAVSDEEAAHRFYGVVLGLDQLADRTYDLAGSDLSFAWAPDAPSGRPTGGPGFTYLTLQVMDLAAAHDTLCSRGARELQPPTSGAFATDASVSFITDPDGNTIELSERPDLVAAATSEEQP